MGYSNLSERQLAKSLEISKANNWSSFSYLQAYYSVTGRDLEYELFPHCREEELGLLPWSPLAGEFLTGKYRHDGIESEDARRNGIRLTAGVKEEGYDVVEVIEE